MLYGLGEVHFACRTRRLTVRTLRVRYSDMPPRYRRKLKAQRKASMIYIRVTDDQKRLFENTATKLGLDVSSWVRSFLIREAKRLSAEERVNG